MAGFAGVDFIDFDSQLNDEEKLVRQTARRFVDNEIIPIIEKHSREGTFPKHLVPQLGELGFFGANLEGYGCAGMSNVAYGLVTQELERGDSGLRSFVSVQSALVMYPIYAYGSDKQKRKVAAAASARDGLWLFWIDGAAIWLEPRRNANARGEKRRELRFKWREDVDHQRIDCGRCGGLGEVRGRKNPRIPGGKRHAGIQGLGCARKMVVAGLGDVRVGVHGLRNPARKFAAECRGIERAFGLLESGALRNWLGSARCGDGLLRYGAAVCEDAETICEQADRFAPTSAGKTGLDDYRDC